MVKSYGVHYSSYSNFYPPKRPNRLLPWKSRWILFHLLWISRNGGASIQKVQFSNTDQVWQKTGKVFAWNEIQTKGLFRKYQLSFIHQRAVRLCLNFKKVFSSFLCFFLSPRKPLWPILAQNALRYDQSWLAKNFFLRIIGYSCSI